MRRLLSVALLLTACGPPPLRSYRTTPGLGLTGALIPQIYKAPRTACQVEFGCKQDETFGRLTGSLAGRWGWRPSAHTGIMVGGYFEHPSGEIISNGEVVTEPRVWGLFSVQGEHLSLGVSPEVGTRSAGGSVGVEVFPSSTPIDTHMPVGLHASYRHLWPYEPDDRLIDPVAQRWDLRLGYRFMPVFMAWSLEGTGGPFERSTRAERRWSILWGFDLPVGELPVRPQRDRPAAEP